MDSLQRLAVVETRHPARRISVVLALFGSILPLTSWAQGTSPPATDVPEPRRELAGHVFIPSKYTLDPFVSTYVASETGFGYGTAPGYNYDLAGHPISSAQYEVGAFAQILDYQYGFVDWWAVRVAAQIIVYSGLNGSGAAAIGTNAVGHFGFGTTMSFKVGESVRLGWSFDANIGPSVFFNVVKSVKDSISMGEVVAPITSSTGYQLLPAFVGAWAIEKWVGLTFAAGYTFTNANASNGNSTSTQTANLVSGNAMFDFDLGALHWIPIGFIAGFQTTFSANQTQFLQFRYQFGIFYTGVKLLNVGLEVDYNRAPVVANLETFISSLQGLIVLQYNFN